MFTFQYKVNYSRDTPTILSLSIPYPRWNSTSTISNYLQTPLTSPRTCNYQSRCRDTYCITSDKSSTDVAGRSRQVSIAFHMKWYFREHSSLIWFDFETKPSSSVVLVSNLNQTFLGYFHPVEVIFIIEIMNFGVMQPTYRTKTLVFCISLTNQNRPFCMNDSALKNHWKIHMIGGRMGWKLHVVEHCEVLGHRSKQQTV